VKNKSKKIAYFITGHGYGHGVRSSTIINALSADTEVYIFTSLPQKFFHEELTRPFQYLFTEIDCGCIQPDTVKIDILATLEKYAALDKRRDELLAQVVTQLRELRIDCVLGDIPPLAFAIAHNAGLPSCAITNFTWADIYQPYIEIYPQFSYLLEKILNDYTQANNALLLWPGLENRVFRYVESVGLLFRHGQSCREAISKRFGLDSSKKWCLVYIGNYGLSGIHWENLSRFPDYEFFGLYQLQNAPANYHLLTKDASYRYADLTSSTDVILGKLGYGLVSECLGLGKPVLFLAREDFIEYDALKRPLVERGQGIEIDADTLRALDLQPALDQLVSKSYPQMADNALKRIIERINGLC